MDAYIVQGCDEVGTVEAKEQDVEVRTVLRLIWWTETVQSSAAAPSPAFPRRWGGASPRTVGISTSPRRFSLLFFSLLSASMLSSSALLLGHFTDTVSGTLSPPLRWGQLQTSTCSLSLLCWSTRLTCSSRHFSTLARSSQGTSWPASSRPLAASATAAC